MNILIASITNTSPDILDAHLKTLKWQELPEGVEAEFFYFVDPEISGESVEVLRDHEIPFEYAEKKPQGARYEVTERTHEWTRGTFGWLAREKQKLLDRADTNGYDGIWLVDSDLLCGPDTLKSLVETERSVVSGVFWTSWTPDQPPLPQVWLQHPYELQGKGYEFHEFVDALSSRRLLQVGGLGACTLIRRDVLPKVGFWPLIEGLPNHSMWQGEDRHFCVRAERNHVDLWADAWPDIWHCYYPKDREEIETRLKELSFKRSDLFSVRDEEIVEATDAPRIGDLVSFTLSPIEEPQLAGHTEHIRGRLGTLRLVPDIERALQEMSVGEDRFVRVKFPIWYPLAPYRGQERTLRIRLLGAKPWRLPPTLADSSYASQSSLAFAPFYAGTDAPPMQRV